MVDFQKIICLFFGLIANGIRICYNIYFKSLYTFKDIKIQLKIGRPTNKKWILNSTNSFHKSKIFCLKLRPKFPKSGENLCYIQGALPLSFANDEEPIHWDESKSITVNQNLSWTLRHVLMPPKTTLVLLSTTMVEIIYKWSSHYPASFLLSKTKLDSFVVLRKKEAP